MRRKREEFLKKGLISTAKSDTMSIKEILTAKLPDIADSLSNGATVQLQRMRDGTLNAWEVRKREIRNNATAAKR